MKRGKSYDWIPLWIDKWLMGSTRFELEPGERSVFIDLMVLGAKDDGFIRANASTGYPHEYLARTLNVSVELLETAIDRCARFGKIKKLKNGIYYVKNWESYRLSNRHKRRVMSEKADIVSGNPDIVSDKADAFSVSVLSKSSSKGGVGGGPRFEVRHMELAKFLKGKVRENVPYHKFTGTNYLESWAREFRLMEDRDKIPFQDIKSVLERSLEDEFWRINILSAGTFREKFGRLAAKMKEPGNGDGRRQPDPPRVGKFTPPPAADKELRSEYEAAKKRFMAAKGYKTDDDIPFDELETFGMFKARKTRGTDRREP